MLGKIIKFTKKIQESYQLLILGVLLPLILSLKNVLGGGMAFWFDPARDFLLAQSNLQKFTLIGQPTGIPGIFYGPYWIWLISLGLIISRDPRIVTALILTIPYCLFFPYLLFRLKYIFGKLNCLILWLLFYFSYKSYLISPWNPHLAPLLFLFYFYLIINIKFDSTDKKNLFKIIITGTTGGLIISFNFSFGLGILISSFLFLIINFLGNLSKDLKQRKMLLSKFIVSFFIYNLGVIIAFAPLIVFEARHGFNQTQTMIRVITDALFYNTAAVGVVGLKTKDIWEEIFTRYYKLIGVNNPETYLILVSLLAIAYFIFYYLRKKTYFREEEKKILLFFVVSLVCLMTLFLSSKNPVWTYHFIGTEVLFLFIIGLIIKRVIFFRQLLAILLLWLISVNLYKLVYPDKINPYSLSSLTTKKYILDNVYQDSKNQPFTIFIYSPSIYTYDYDYIISWYAKDKYFYMPERELKNNYPVYLIIPKTEPAVKEDFINYKTPQNLFKTDKIWKIDDGTTIIKRVKME